MFRKQFSFFFFLFVCEILILVTFKGKLKLLLSGVKTVGLRWRIVLTYT